MKYKKEKKNLENIFLIFFRQETLISAKTPIHLKGIKEVRVTILASVEDILW